MRYLYNFLFYLFLPFIFMRLWWRSVRQPDYRKRWQERLGFYPFKLDRCIWVHAVSVGETLAAIPLIKLLQERYPTLPLVVTTMTPTGAARVKSAFAERVHHVYIPYDLPSAVERFLTSMNPMIGIIMETELWPNLLNKSYQKNIPVCLVNARLSEKSAKGYQRIANLTRAMLQQIHLIAAHGYADAKRFIALGASEEKVKVTGNIKFDLTIPADLPLKSAALRAELGKARFVWIAASTHQGEEEIILAAHKKLREKNPQALLILVPRHPDRFDVVVKLAEQQFVTVRRSQMQSDPSKIEVYVGDTMGELLMLYGVADVAFVGGSLIPRGGHNMLEPAALNLAILTGPHLFNFAEISELFIAANALLTVKDEMALVQELISLMENVDTRTQMGARAFSVMAANKGALAKQVALIEQVLGG